MSMDCFPRPCTHPLTTKVATQRIAGTIPELIFGHGIAIGVAHREQAGRGKGLAALPGQIGRRDHGIMIGREIDIVGRRT